MRRALVLASTLIGACFSPSPVALPAIPAGAKTLLLFGEPDNQGRYEIDVETLPVPDGAELGVAVPSTSRLTAVFFGCDAERLQLDASSPPAPLPPTSAVTTLDGGEWRPLGLDEARASLAPVRYPRIASDACKNIGVNSTATLRLRTSTAGIHFGAWLDPASRTIVAGDSDGCLHVATPGNRGRSGHNEPAVVRDLPCDQIRVKNAGYDPRTDKVWGIGLRGLDRITLSLDHEGNLTIEDGLGPPELDPLWTFLSYGGIRFSEKAPFEMYAMSHFCDVGRYDGHEWRLVADGTEVVDGDLTWIDTNTILIAGLCDAPEPEPVTSSLGCRGQLTKATVTDTGVTIERERLLDIGIVDALTIAPNGAVYAGTKNGALLTREPNNGSWSGRSLETNEGVELLAPYGDDVIASMDGMQVLRYQSADEALCDSAEVGHEVRGIAVYEKSIALIGEARSGGHLEVTWLEPLEENCRLPPISRDSQ